MCGTASAGKAAAATAGEQRQIMEMGFSAEQARRALGVCHNNVGDAINYLFEHPDPPAPPARGGGGGGAGAGAGGGAGSGSGVMDLTGGDDDAADAALPEHTVNVLAARYDFGPNAFGPLRRKPPQVSAARDLSGQVRALCEASVDGVARMRGQRGQKYVTQMLTACYRQGLFMHGPPSSAVNVQIIPAIRTVVAAMAALPARDPKRVACLTTLANACLDCQQVQAREILRAYSDLTAQTETMERQLKYSLVRQKEAALQVLITARHGPTADQDHTRVSPWQQRAHLFSGYVSIVGEQFGLDGLTAAKGDRFCGQALGEIGRGVQPGALIQALIQGMSVKEWLQTLLADINNQNANADRLIDRGAIFAWVQQNLVNGCGGAGGGQTFSPHLVFYDEARAAEFADLDPKAPTQANQYQPFLSPRVLVEMLVRAGMLVPKAGAAVFGGSAGGGGGAGPPPDDDDDL